MGEAITDDDDVEKAIKVMLDRFGNKTIHLYTATVRELSENPFEREKRRKMRMVRSVFGEKDLLLEEDYEYETYWEEKEKKFVDVQIKHLFMSQYLTTVIKSIIEEGLQNGRIKMDEEKDVEVFLGVKKLVIPVVNTDQKALKFVADFMHHEWKEPTPVIPKPFAGGSLKSSIGEWNVLFAKTLLGDTNMKSRVLMTAHYMNIPPLISILGLSIAKELDGKNAKEIRQTFGLKKVEFKSEDDRKAFERKLFEK
ncbi:MAG: hypothetical protein ACTSUE_11260 [Promethearchaeota archaeon]